MFKQRRFGRGEGRGSQRLRIKVPAFDNGDLIKGYNRTLIGRCMNPNVQHMENLLYMLPRIWNVEERVAGADLGNGCFQFDFDKEEDIVNVLKMEPFHFDRWMLSKRLVNKRSGSGEKKEDTTKTLLGGKEELIPAEDGALHKESQMVNFHENGVSATGESSEIAEEMAAPVGHLRMAEDTEGLQENREEGDGLSLESVVLREPILSEDGESGPELENVGAMEVSDKEEDKSELGNGKQGVRKRLFPATSIGRGMGSRK